MKSYCYILLFSVTLSCLYTTLSSFSEEESDVIYIRPVNVQCPSESCLTLSQFAQNTTLEHQSFIFLPGNHNLDTEIVVANISKVIFMIPNSSLVATIYCQNKAYLKFHEIKHLLIVGLNFIGFSILSLVFYFIIEFLELRKEHHNPSSKYPHISN